MTRVTLVTCVWRRHELTRAFWIWAAWLRQRWALTHQIQLELVAAASDPREADLAKAFGAKVVLHPNEPLGAKFNAALTASRETTPDWVLIMGSDDFFCEKAADALGDAVRDNRSVGFQDIYFADLPTQRMRYIPGYRVKSRHTEPVGPGTLHSAALLEQFHWRLWDGTKHHGMDHSRFRTLKVHHALPELLNLRALDAVMVDVKTETNLWPFDRTRKQPVLTAAEGQAVWDRLPEEVLGPWSKAMAA